MEEKEFFWNEHIKVFVSPCVMPHGGDTFTTIGIEVINFRRKDVEIQYIDYGAMRILPEHMIAKDPTMPHVVAERNRWFFYLTPQAMANLDPKVIEEVCVVTTRGYRFVSEVTC